LLRPTTAKVASVPFLAMRGSGYIRGRVCQAQSDPGCAIVSIGADHKVVRIIAMVFAEVCARI